ncbi:glycolate oxidase FAD binding subunit [Salinihabitans flavidus]|uniref:Glycolate oxidase FAD binding subunit n=1 Tax=Salinihabitans flavidus TaxID=569882 RepID=A0A1H8S7S3_9RHOB|nr:FAD-binding protein [Salinihabitans flavidus]SEO74576.1 glycolate oxidase FAD binding subunit [Salinihabitans flavidus]
MTQAARPQSEAELAEIVAGSNGPLRIAGGGTRRSGGAGAALTTRGLSGVTLHEPGALTLVARAGTPLAEVERVLASEGQRLAFEPMDHRGLLGTKGAPTIGGAVAANVSGPRRVVVGAARDFLLGVRFVDGQGRILKNGGRVMKNVTGYDLVKLMAGSWGTLGVITEVSLKVLPAPEVTGTLLIEGLSDADAVRAMAAALGSPFEVTGAAHLPGDAPLTLLRIEGMEASVAYRAEALCGVLSEFGVSRVETDPEAGAALWRAVRDVEAFHGRDGHVWRLSVKPSEAPELVARLGAEAVIYDWGGGLVWALAAPGVDVRAAMAGTKGHATLIRGEGPPMFHPEPAPIARISEGLRAAFDPRGVFNPGLMG